MALVNINDPGDAPVSIADWYKVNAVLQTIGNGMGGGSRVVGSVFPRGAVVFFAGAWYIADADTAISGTASKYVKITNTAGVLSLSFVAGITGVTWNKQYQGYYDALGNMYLFDEIIAYGDGAIDTLYSIVNFRASQQFAFVLSNLTGQFRKILKPSGKEILTYGSGTYAVSAGVYSLEYFIQGPGAHGNSGGASGQQLHGFIEVTPNQSISWVVSPTETTFGALTLPAGGGFSRSKTGNGYSTEIYTGGGTGSGAGSGRGGNSSYAMQIEGGNIVTVPATSGETGRIEIW